ncbi:hypothetical protein OG986_02280 [Streptomyces cellulosae]|uniref:hypothetical protein n=1 Tax=Streptomyces sp. Akac8 TaxID=2563106 RepID=UPI00109EDF89|nr:hypothetical protein E7X38_00215 [Streptomyces sp. Akac8]
MSDTQLTVTLSGGNADDARAVVGALEGTFGPPDERPSDTDATVRMATFGGEGEGTGAGQDGVRPLSEPVTVTVQGTPDALSRVFTARDEGAAAGDQEQERQLVLES